MFGGNYDYENVEFSNEWNGEFGGNLYLPKPARILTYDVQSNILLLAPLYRIPLPSDRRLIEFGKKIGTDWLVQSLFSYSTL